MVALAVDALADASPPSGAPPAALSRARAISIARVSLRIDDGIAPERSPRDAHGQAVVGALAQALAPVTAPSDVCPRPAPSAVAARRWRGAEVVLPLQTPLIHAFRCWRTSHRGEPERATAPAEGDAPGAVAIRVRRAISSDSPSLCVLSDGDNGAMYVNGWTAPVGFRALADVTLTASSWSSLVVRGVGLRLRRLAGRRRGIALPPRSTRGASGRLRSTRWTPTTMWHRALLARPPRMRTVSRERTADQWTLPVRWAV